MSLSIVDAVKEFIAAADSPQVNGDSMANAINALREKLRAQTLASEDELREVRRMYGSKEIEFDDSAIVSESDDGVWVQGWVWLPAEKED